ncbi:sensor histidine kinase [Clostridium saccharobutylicum]|uniref:histidine kinase n=1 Tax=Clostridium saccharobutylicum DSM 13864 TaxID=1345695 RepID=U5MM82_CLOSA|nr:HAMP domain-containing sensor histidine kinase [Clostridium saccharobutylicum]AGX41638.1 sensor histidine kinase YcbM [Clostridium saccharobutylicum DSM 13864]AQR88921.1 sensor histidine kinase TodS [Clostridium saccharobutylicum]AQR98822.1 sensor histidine kinase TodS [Clostridium saccharobutylicum]AQS12810.1 sensor histidine kinase TodS [Clostridium saccharobutylicum]MBA2904078.1 signal transduction histidine kinase [Clostridium saccharobutylicum]
MNGFPLFEGIIVIVALIYTLLLSRKIRNIKLKLNDISEVLDDIAQGNSNRKILAKSNDMTSIICYKINNIIHEFQGRIIDLKKAEKMNSQLMTSLSHDVRTPLTTLIGYLDAAQKGIVVGKEKEEYIETARLRAHDIKDYVNVLFEWFKLNSNEETFMVQKVELTEVTRKLLKDWIPIFENNSLDFDIDIPEKFIKVNLDTDAYSRIMNNLIQNVIAHSQANHIKIKVSILRANAVIVVADDGKGISKQDLPHVFERLYKCDIARSKRGSGLGLSIVQQLVEKMGGVIVVKSQPYQLTEFIVQFPLID